MKYILKKLLQFYVFLVFTNNALFTKAKAIKNTDLVVQLGT